MNYLHAIDYFIVGSYFVFAIAVGLYFSRRASRSPEDFFLGGRSLPWWAIGVSMVATSFASDTPLVITEVIRQYGIQRLWWILASVMVLIVGIFLFSRLWRRAEIITDAEFYELRYEGRPAAFLRGFRAFSSGIIQNLITMGWVIYGMTTIITTLTGLNEWLAISICIAVALTYATAAGFYGVVVTDVVQFAIATVSMIVLAVAGVHQAGGLACLLDSIKNMPGYGEHTLEIFPDVTTFNNDLVALVVFLGLLWWSDAGGYNMQRMSACRNERDAVKATIFYALFQSIRLWLWVPVALVSIVWFPVLNEPYSDTHAYPLVMRDALGPGLLGLLVTSFLAAFMSTIDTHLNWGASYLMNDVYRRFLRPQATHKEYMLATRLVTVVLMVSAAAVVPLMNSVHRAWEFLAIVYVGYGIVSVARWFWWRINAYTEITATVLGLLCGIFDLFAATFAEESFVLFGTPWVELRFEIKIAMLIAIVVPISLVVTMLTPPVSMSKLEKFYRKVRPGGAWGPVSARTKKLPGRALTWTSVFDIAGGIAMCYGLSVAIGYCLLLRFYAACLCLGFAALGAVRVAHWYRREIAGLDSADNSRED
jgi:SSS family solute:Na+ symporter